MSRFYIDDMLAVGVTFHWGSMIRLVIRWNVTAQLCFNGAKWLIRRLSPLNITASAPFVGELGLAAFGPKRLLVRSPAYVALLGPFFLPYAIARSMRRRGADRQ